MFSHLRCYIFICSFYYKIIIKLFGCVLETACNVCGHIFSLTWAAPFPVKAHCSLYLFFSNLFFLDFTWEKMWYLSMVWIRMAPINSQSSGSDTTWEEIDVTLLEEMCYWGQTLRFKNAKTDTSSLSSSYLPSICRTLRYFSSDKSDYFPTSFSPR